MSTLRERPEPSENLVKGLEGGDIEPGTPGLKSDGGKVALAASERDKWEGGHWNLFLR